MTDHSLIEIGIRVTILSKFPTIVVVTAQRLDGKIRTTINLVTNLVMSSLHTPFLGPPCDRN